MTTEFIIRQDVYQSKLSFEFENLDNTLKSIIQQILNSFDINSFGELYPKLLHKESMFWDVYTEAVSLIKDVH